MGVGIGGKREIGETHKEAPSDSQYKRRHSLNQSMYQGSVCTWILALFHPEHSSLMTDCGLGGWNHEWHWGFSLRTWKNGFVISQDEDPLGHTSLEGQSQQPKRLLRERLQTSLQSSG